MRKSKTAFLSALFAASLLHAGSSAAHTVWLQPDTTAGVWRVYFGGHAGKIESYPAFRLKSAEAFDSKGKPVGLQRTDAEDGVRLKPGKEVALIAMHYDNGIWSRTPEGRSVDKPMNEVAGSTKATRAIKFHKTIVHWSDFVARPLGQEFEVTPISAAQPKAGKPMQVRVTMKGKPMAGIKIGRGEEGTEGVTDAQGVASFMPTAGFNKLWAGDRAEIKDNPQFTELSYEYLLGFDAE